MSEHQLHTHLEDPRVPNRGDLTEVARRGSAADVVELGVVERVKALYAELQTASALFAEYEALEERDVPVIAARLAYLAGRERTPRPDRRCGKRARVRPL